MNEKITLRLLADRLPAEIFGSDSDSRSAFISEIFAAAAELLSEGQTMNIKGLGSFVPNPGDPQMAVVFTPDDHFSAIVNAPFAGFRPMEIADEVTDNMLEEVAAAEADPESEADREIAASVDVEEAGDADVARRKEEPEVAVGYIPEAEPAAPSVIPSPEPMPEGEIPEAAPLPPSAIPEASPLPPPFIPEASPLPPAYIPEPEPRVQPEIKVEAEEEPDTVIISSVPEPEPVLMEEPEQETELTVEAAPVVSQVTAAEETEDAATSMDGTDLYPEEHKSRFGAGFFWGLLTGLLLGGVVLLLYVMLTGPSLTDPYAAEALDADAVETMME